VKSAVLRSPFLWLGVLLLVALIARWCSAMAVVELARFSSDYQRRIQQSLSTSLRDIQSGSGSLALWTLVAVCSATVSSTPWAPAMARRWCGLLPRQHQAARLDRGRLAGSWIAFTHTLAALLLAGGLKAFASVGLFGALREVRNVEIVSYTLILLIGLWRLWAGLTGRLHEHVHGHATATATIITMITTAEPARRTMAGWLLLTAAGIAPCAGALIVVLLSVAWGAMGRHRGRDRHRARHGHSRWRPSAWRRWWRTG